MDTKTLPPEAFRFLAPAAVSPGPRPASDGAGTVPAPAAERTLAGIAYSGDIVQDHGYWPRLAIDLASLSLAVPVPLLNGHCPDETVGIVTKADTSLGNLAVEARLFADIDPEAAMIAAKADKGFPWQLSVGIWPDSIEEVSPNATIPLNGRLLQGPLTVFRGGNVREVSVVPVAADRLAAATVLEGGKTVFSIPVSPYEDHTMPTAEPNAKIAELEAEVAKLKADNIKLSATPPDPAKFVPVESLQAAMAELAALQKAQLAADIDTLVQAALADGRLLPAQEQWARDLGQANLAALRQFLDTAQPVPALLGTQTGGKPPPGQADGVRDSFKAPDNLGVDLAGLAIHSLAVAHQAQHGGDYLSAVKAVLQTP
jgi:hypothetical protein